MSSDIMDSIIVALVTSNLSATLMQMWSKRKHARFVRLYEKEVDIIAETYALLRKLEACVVRFLDISDPKKVHSKSEQDDAYDAFLEANRRFRDYFESKVIFLPEATVKMIERMHDDLRQAPSIYKERAENRSYGKGVLPWIEFLEAVKTKIPPIRKSLEKEFKNILNGK